MLVKDYYKILEIPVTASQQEIRRSYRKLAHQYHPDKNENTIAEAHFREVIEAYNILSDPMKRDSYNYKRWNQRSNGKKYDNLSFSPKVILQECISLREYIDTVDQFRMNKGALNFHIHEILSTHNISVLLQHNDTVINTETINQLLNAAKPLNYKQMQPLSEKLLSIAGKNGIAITIIHTFIKQKRKAAIWNQYKIVLILAVTFLLCCMIYFLSKPA
jgi:molecular chaperone DnaJ